MLKGTGVSQGIGIAQAMIWHNSVAYDFIPRKSARPEAELKRFEAAHSIMMGKTGDMRQKTARLFGSGEAAIFDAYQLILDDEEVLLAPLRQKIVEEHFSAEHAVATQFDEVARQFMRLEDEYMRQRADDILGLRDQFMRELMGLYPVDISHLDKPTVIVAHSLSPADIANLDLSRLEGIVCETGGYSSHLSIISRTLGVPAVVGLDGVVSSIRPGALVALDGESGEVWTDPDAEEIAMLRHRSDELAERRTRAQLFFGRPTVSVDGRRIELSANIGQLEEVDKATAADAEAIGMFRTELLHMNRVGLPTEDEQFEVYCALLRRVKGKATTVRTFDDGGNRPTLPSLKSRPGDNPVLGYRGIRMSLGRPSFFRTQLRALLRASAYGSLRIMFPMVSNMDELDAALDALEQIKAELQREGVPYDEKMPVGVDIEVPSAALLSEAMAPKVDFFSIGINDLIQFTLAIDRGNPDLSYLYHQYHPAVLRLVQWTVNAAHNNGIPCMVSGEAPGQERVLPLMLGIGVDGFSMNPNMILRARQILNHCNYEDCKRIADEVLQLHSTDEVAKRLNELQPVL